MTDDTKGPPLLTAPPYSKAVLHLCQRIQSAESTPERTELMLQLAGHFHRDHDTTDAQLNDDYHDFFEEYERARLKYQQAAMRLARLAMSEVKEACDRNEMTLTELPQVNKAVN
jgi:hypothetical protein